MGKQPIMKSFSLTKHLTTMKTHFLQVFLYFVILVFFAIPGYAQQEIQVGYGPLSREHILNDAVNNFFRTIVHEPLKRINFSNSYSVTYRYQASRRATFGLSSSVATGNTYKNYLFESASNYKYTSVILAFETRFSYIEKPFLSLYYFAGLGGFVVTERDLENTYNDPRTFAYPTCQITPLGIRYGKKAAIFAEIGYGYKGIINMGISAKF